MYHPRTVHGLPTLYTCLILWLFPVCLFVSHCMTVHGLPAAYVSSYDCSQSVCFLWLILWLSPVCLFMSHLMTLHGPPTTYASSYDYSWSVCFLCPVLWLFPLPVCLPVMSHRMTVPSLSTSGDCSQSHLMVIPCACVHAIFSRLGVCTVSEVQVDLRCDY